MNNNKIIWVKIFYRVLKNDIEKAKERIDSVPKKHPFDLRYQTCVGEIDWESCSKVLDVDEKRKYLMNGWEAKK